MVKLPQLPGNTPDLEMSIKLGTQPVTLRFTWNTRAMAWFLSITFSDQSFLGPLKITQNFPVFHNFSAISQLKGDIVVFKDDPSVGNDITFDSLGNGHGIYFLDPDDLATWKAANGLG